MADGGGHAPESDRPESDRPESRFDWKNPNYNEIFQARLERLKWLRENPRSIAGIKAYYRDHPADFINDWGCTVDPRNVAVGKPSFLPFVLMPKQREMLEWILAHWRAGKPGMIEKSRDAGCSWLAMALACTLCLFHEGMMIGVGSAKEDKLDRTGDPDTLFYKARTFVNSLPEEFRPGWNPDKDAPYMRILSHATGSSITGEAGDDIGRGGRKAIFFVDEAAHIERPLLVDGSLIATTDCRIDISSVSIEGMANRFAQRRHSGQIDVFTFHWRDDLRKDEAWAEAKRANTDPAIWNSEYELNYTAAAEGVIIPQTWVQAAIGAHEKLGIKPSGVKRGALDVADQGRDVNAFAARHGILLTHCSSWSGEGSDLFATTERAFMLCDEQKLEGFDYDADGMGAGIRGDSTRILERRRANRQLPIEVSEFRGSASVFDPERTVPNTDRKNIDMFQNFKAQSWWALRQRFQETYRAVSGQEYDRDAIISLASDLPVLSKLAIELSQPQWKLSLTGKLQVDKVPDGAASPNLADAVMMLFAPRWGGFEISDEILNYHLTASGYP